MGTDDAPDGTGDLESLTGTSGQSSDISARLLEMPDERVYRLLKGKAPATIAAIANTFPRKSGRIAGDRFFQAIRVFAGLCGVVSDIETAAQEYQVPVPIENLQQTVGAAAKQLFMFAIDSERELSAKEKALDDLVKKMGSQEKKNLDVLRTNKDLYKAVMTDHLTGIDSRRSFFTKLPDHIRVADKHGTPLSIILLDVNNFKRINDTYDHDGGDYMLKAIASFMQQNLPRAYVVARLGGDEFGIIVPQATEQEAYLVADALREKVEKHEFVYTVVEGDEEKDYGISTTIALGVKQHEPGEGEDELYRGADATFYTAHRLGKNRTIKYSEFLEYNQKMPEAEPKHPRNLIETRKHIKPAE